jgi:hypothetical protein
MKYKFNVWWMCNKQSLKFIEKIEVEADAEKDATELVNKKIRENVRVCAEYK